jgi:diguanylate cyclase (GGDEF)-like protein
MQFNISVLISLLSLLSYFVILFIMIRRDTSRQLSRFFVSYLVSMIIWSFGSLMIFAEIRSGGTLFWNRFMVIGSMAMPFAFYSFVQVFLAKKRNGWFYLGLGLYFTLLIADILGLIIEEAAIVDGRLINEYGPLLNISSLTWVLFMGLSIHSLWRAHSKSNRPDFRNRIRYLIFVVVVIFIGSLTNATALQVYPIDIALNIFAAFLLTYAIVRLQLLDFSLAIRKGLLYSLPTVVIGAGYFLIIELALNMFHLYSGVQLFLLSLLVAIVTALVAQPFRELAQAKIDKLFFREKVDSALMIQHVSQHAASVLDLKRLATFILSELTKTLHIEKAAFFLSEASGDRLSVLVHKGLKNSSELIWQKSHPVVRYLKSEGQSLFSREIVILPIFKALWEKEQEELTALEAELFVPIKIKGKLAGILALGRKKSGEEFTLDEHRTLMILANQTAVAIENAILFDLEAQRRREAETLRQAVTGLVSSLDTEEVLEGILLQLRGVVPYDSASVQMRVGEHLHIVAGRGFPRLDEVIGKQYPITDDLPYLQIENTAGPLIVADTSLQSNIHAIGDLASVQSWMAVPLKIRGKVIGSLNLDSHAKNRFSQAHADSTQAFADHAAVAIENARLFGEVQRLAITDELTGIANRRQLFELGEREVVRTRRFGRSLSAMMFDVDNFKEINDQHGHAIGDQILQFIARQASANIREIDIFGRYGGDEFAILLPEADLNMAVQVAERFRQSLTDVTAPTKIGPMKTTISVGVRPFDDDIVDLAQLLEAADEALLHAKKIGKNCISTFAGSRIEKTQF